MMPFRELGLPARVKRDAQNNEDVENFRKQYNNKNLFISVYNYSLWDEKEKHPDYNSAIINKIFFEIEEKAKEGFFSENVHREEQKLLLRMEKLKIPFPKITFSGRRGYHNEIYFPEIKLRNIDKALKETVENIIEKEWGINNICHGSQKGTTQMKRLVNSCHGKTGLYAVRILPSEILSNNYAKILELAKNIRDIQYEKKLFEPLSKYLINIDGIITQRIEEGKREKMMTSFKSDSPLSFEKFGCSENGKTPLCIQKLINKLREGINLTHFERFIFTSFMGMNLKNKNREEIILKYFVKQPDFSETKTRYQIHHILSKKYFPPRCETLKRVGLCKNP